jgi:HopA1 effector protein family
VIPGSPYHDQVAAALAVVRIRGPTRYEWMGRTSRALPAALDARLNDSERRTYLVSCLREELYSSFYCHGQPVPARWGESVPPFADPWLVAVLSEANTGRGSWAPGWTVLRLEGDEAVVADAHLRLRVPVSECRTPAGELRPDVAVSMRLPKELPELTPGFFTVLSEAPSYRGSSGSVLRVYWNVAAADAPGLVRQLTSRLNGRGVPFRLKVADHPFRFARCDATVLYLQADAFGSLREGLQEVAASLGARLRPKIPAFALELSPGVGLAEDTGDGESFGERRCALFADGIVRAHEQGIRRADARIEAVAARFAEDGVRIEAPYLEPSLAGRHVL